ncbi:MAG: hypothetical protein WA989_01665, partial [Henriciella sp.]|uniref:hypothetical protein n=1 Tax=Henriciella sp. TaxID=1968823 RepID=UPI003C784FB7
MWNNVQLNAQVNLLDQPEILPLAPKPSAEVVQLHANPCQILADAMAAYLQRDEDLAKRGDAVLEMSFLLRRALSVNLDDMAP